MLRLLLIRHAKSSWKFPELNDHDRPLNKRGRRDSVSMAKHLANKNEQLDVIYSSTAVRAFDFAYMISQFIDTDLQSEPNLYTFDSRELINVLKSLPALETSVAIVAHNPAITYVANLLTNHQIRNVPTAGVITINFNIQSWAELRNSSGKIDYFDYPKMLVP